MCTANGKLSRLSLVYKATFLLHWVALPYEQCHPQVRLNTERRTHRMLTPFIHPFLWDTIPVRYLPLNHPGHPLDTLFYSSCASQLEPGSVACDISTFRTRSTVNSLRVFESKYVPGYKRGHLSWLCARRVVSKDN